MRPGSLDYRIRKQLHLALKAPFIAGSPQRRENYMYTLVANAFFPFNTRYYNVQLLLNPEHDAAWRAQPRGTPPFVSDEVPF